ncbi:K18430 legI, neuB2; N,N'-diacetyllegionaminate synthase [Candidatus Pelagibacterales bacterium]
MKIQLTRKKNIYNYCSPYIIAEIGANHNGDMDLAKKMIDSAIECGCDAVKFQSWNKKSLISNTGYKQNTIFNDSKKKHFGSLEEMVDKYYLRKEQHFELKNYCKLKSIDFCSTPFSKEEVDLLNEVDVEFYKVASMDINNYPLLQYVAQFNKPILLSTGMANLGEIEKAVKIIENEGNSKIVILHCVAIYPTENKDLNLKNITMLQNTFGYPVGFSDHSLGFVASLASVALGVCIIEKHFTIDKNLPGWDHEISANPEEMRKIVEGSKIIHESLGNFKRTISKAEEEKKKVFRRSIVLNKNLKAENIIREEDISLKRPGTGFSTDEIKFVVGKKLKRDCEADYLLTKDDII